MNKAIVRDLAHFDNAIDLACLDCLEGMLQVWPLKPSSLRSTSLLPQRAISTSSLWTTSHAHCVGQKARVGPNTQDTAEHLAATTGPSDSSGRNKVWNFTSSVFILTHSVVLPKLPGGRDFASRNS